MTFEKPIDKVISANNAAVEFWTDANTGIWQPAGSLELIGLDNWRKAYFLGELPILEPSGDNTPYGVTARVSLDPGNEKAWQFIRVPLGNALIKASFAPTQETIDAWRDALGVTYSGVMLDMDGTMKFYNSGISDDIKANLIDILHKGVNVAISSSRDDGIYIAHFFAELEEKADQMGKKFNKDLCHVYLKNGKYGYNVKSGDPYYQVFLSMESKKAVRKLFKEENVYRFLIPDSYRDSDKYRITFAFRGGIDREVFAKKLNEKLAIINKNLSEYDQVVALYTDDLFEICSKKGTKETSLNDFSSRIGVPIKNIARIGDQGELYGIDEPMINSPGGFSAYHINSASKYPLSIPAMANKRNADAVAYLLKNLEFSPVSKIGKIEKPITATQL
jgi:hydroxymethylpyrimidine pyrophosphatase-like HAD family hydrolase